MRMMVGFAALLLGAITASAASGLPVAAFDFLSNLLWHFAILAVLLAVAAYIAKARKIAIFAFFVAIFAVVQTQRFDVQMSDPIEGWRDEKIFTVFAFNSWARVANAKRIADYLREKKPDFAILMEIDPNKYAVFGDLKDIYPHMRYCKHPNCRVVLMSKYPWSEVTSGRQEHHYLPKVEAHFGLEFGNLRLIGIHAYRPHIYYEDQRLQFESFGASLAGATDPIVIGGDFNSTPFSAPLRQFSKTSGLKHAGRYRTTWPRRTRHLEDMALPFTQLGLDQYFVNERIAVIHVERGPDLGSDHLPLIMTFGVRGL